jgi:DnaJ-class molecular chaperone
VPNPNRIDDCTACGGSGEIDLNAGMGERPFMHLCRHCSTTGEGHLTREKNQKEKQRKFMDDATDSAWERNR